MTSSEPRTGSVLYLEIDYCMYFIEETIETYLLQSQYNDQPSSDPEIIKFTIIVNYSI
jgi:hypothetical protein